MANFLWRKHPSLRVAAITRTEDEIIRLFYSVGLNECKDYERVHPVLKTVLGFFDSSQLYGAERYAAALADVRDYLVAQRYPLSTFMIGPPDATRHQLVFRPDFYTRRVQGRTAAQFVSTFLSGDVVQLGPN